jgi:peptide/nickel transport system substrate-binding protein
MSTFDRLASSAPLTYEEAVNGMKRRNLIGTALVGAAVTLTAACGSGAGGTSSATSGYGAAITAVVNASNATGGTLNYGLTNAPDSTDPGNFYYAFMWDFSRLYASPLLSYKPAPGKAGLQLVPDLATGLGQSSEGGLTWTYHLKSGLTYQDGSPITSKDVKYAVERSNYSSVLTNGPQYFHQYLADPSYPGPYGSGDTTPDKLGLTSITTPDDTTVVFHLQRPFADFDYLATLPQTAPVPRAHDTGAKYAFEPWSSGPYKFKSYNPNTGFSLVKNTNWKQSSDPFVKQTVDTINVSYNIAANELDSRVLGGSFDLDLRGAGVQTAARAKILGNRKFKNNADAPLSGFLYYFPIDTQVVPNIDCRKAIEYAVDKTVEQNAYGGPIVGGDIASTLLPPSVVGYQKFDEYEATSQPHGDIAKAKAELQKCGKPNGFSVNVATRGDQPNEVAAATGVQQALAKVGIKADVLPYPSGTYTNTYVGSPAYMQQHNIGLAGYSWGADWPDGFGFLSQIADGRAIKAAGNSNLEMLNDPQVNSLFDKATTSPDATTRASIYSQIDKLMMDKATAVPAVYSRSLLYRNPDLTNVFVTQAYGMYDYTQIGKS